MFVDFICKKMYKKMRSLNLGVSLSYTENISDFAKDKYNSGEL